MTRGTLIDAPSLAKEFGRAFGEPAWLVEMRAAAMDAYLKAPLPSRARHLWRSSDPGAFVPEDGAVAAGPREPASSAEARRPPEDLARALEAGEISGAIVEDATGPTRICLPSEIQGRGVLALGLREAARAARGLVEGRLGTLVGAAPAPDGAGKFEALNAALWTSGAFVLVPRGVRLEAPIYIRRSLPEGAAFAAVRTLLVLEEGAEATLVEEHEGGASSLANAVSELFALEGARLRHVFVQRLGEGARLHAAGRASAGRDAQIVALAASLGALAAKCDLGSRLEGPGARAELYGFLFGDGRQSFDHHTVHHHRARHTSSDLDFKVVLCDRARSAYTGLIRIEPEAPASEAYQENRNLVLGDEAKATSIPELEILTDDVRCTHGATVGSLDPNEVFYLRSRGLDRAEATRLIVEGFIEPAASRLPEAVRRRVLGDVERKMRRL